MLSRHNDLQHIPRIGDQPFQGLVNNKLLFPFSLVLPEKT